MLKDELAELIGVNVRTIYNHVDMLEKSGLILDITKKHGYGEYAHNVYQLEYLNKEYFIMNPSLITEQGISPKLKGLLMLIKANCVKGTNYLEFKSKQHLSEILHIGKNTLPKYLDELEAKGFISYIDDALILPKEYFHLYIKENLHNQFYETIYDYCLSQNVKPPYKDKHTHDIGLLVAEFSTPDKLLSKLKERCPQLPQNVSMAYFTKTLVNKRAITEKPIEYEIYID